MKNKIFLFLLCFSVLVYSNLNSYEPTHNEMEKCCQKIEQINIYTYNYFADNQLLLTNFEHNNFCACHNTDTEAGRKVADYTLNNPQLKYTRIRFMMSPASPIDVLIKPDDTYLPINGVLQEIKSIKLIC